METRPCAHFGCITPTNQTFCEKHKNEHIGCDKSQEPYEEVNHPSHYGGADNSYEAIKVIRAWKLGFNLGNTVKYISRAGKKPDVSIIKDLEKALWYLNDELETLKKEQQK